MNAEQITDAASYVRDQIEWRDERIAELEEQVRVLQANGGQYEKHVAATMQSLSDIATVKEKPPERVPPIATQGKPALPRQEIAVQSDGDG